MKKCIFLSGIFALCFLASCNGDQDVIQMQSTENISVSLSECAFLSEDSQVKSVKAYTSELTIPKDSDIYATRSVINDTLPIRRAVAANINGNSIVEMTGYGYSTTSIAAAKTKCYYRSSSPIMLGVGLAGGYYFVEILKVKKTLSSYRAGDLINPVAPIADNKDMGTKECGFFETTLGWAPDEIIENGDQSFAGTTYLIHFLYTLGGAQLDKYYPCRPENLVWNYESILLNVTN